MTPAPIRYLRQVTDAIADFFNLGLWRMQLEGRPAGQRLALRLLRALTSALAEFFKDQCMLRASALTFYTLMSIVPLLAVLFGIAKGFGLEQMLEKELIERMSGQEQAFERILAFSRRLLENTQGGIMAGVGVVVMLWAALKAVGQIESALNAIWDVPAPRRWVRKFTDYLALMLIAPVLLISASSATIFIRTQIDTVAGYLRVSGLVAPLVEAVFKFGPVLIIWTLFTLIYKAMPNKRVPLSTAIVGGVFGGSLFLIVQGVYIAFQIGVANSNAIYGSFAALPLFLVWVQTSWTIVLFGAEFGYAFEHAPSYSCPTGHPAFGPGEKKLLALKITRRLVRRFSEGRPALGLSDLSRELKLSERFLEPVLADLQQGGIVSETGAGGRRAFQPAVDIHRLAIGAVLAAMDRSFPSGRRRPDEDEETRSLVEVLQDFHRAAAAAPANRLVKDL